MIAQNAAGSHAWEQVEQLVVQEVRELYRAVAAAPSAEAVEQLAWEWSRRVGQEADPYKSGYGLKNGAPGSWGAIILTAREGWYPGGRR